MFGRISNSKCHSAVNNLSQIIDKCASNINSTIQAIKNKCNENSCDFKVSSDLFGDPCINYSKYLDIKYSCS